MKTYLIKMKKSLKWVSIGLIAVGIILGGIGALCGGINTIDFLFWL